ncbi:fibrocystin-L-like [Pecten maximus]|uniref:fibrocystin-L-like n=1 Tax=Pecten maximus TaxID=6579 RepID=UPI001458800A|nr:fibrocystin-L-like [Pecten maximus]
MYFKDNSTDDEYVARLSVFYIVQETGIHRVTVKGRDGTQVYINATGGTLVDPSAYVVRCLYTCNSYHHKVSEDLSFTKGQLIYMEMVCRHSSKESFCGAMITRDVSTTTADSTSEVKQEKKRIHVSSVETVNIQKLKLKSSFGQSSFSPTVVTLDLGNIDPTAKFKLTLFGYSSDWIVSTAAAAVIQTTLNKMPLMEGKISVTERTSTTVNAKFDITFDLDMGNIPVTSIQTATDKSQLTASISEGTAGVAGLGNLNLQLGENILAPPIPTPITADKIQTALRTAIGAICPKEFNQQEAARLLEDFESAQGLTCGDTLDTTVDAFCGRSSLKNPSCIFKRQTRQAFSADLKMCFAYKGNMSDNFKSVCLESSGSNRTVFTPTHLSTIESWNYTCVTLSDLVSTECTHVVSVEFHGYQGDRWIDAFMVTENTDFFNNGPENVMNQIRPQPRLGSGEGQLVGDVSVVKEVDQDGSDAFLITIVPQECGYAIPQIKPYGSQANADGDFQVGPNGLVECTTTTSANPPVTGSVTLGFMGKSITVMADASADQIQQDFQNKGEFVSVDHTGNCSDFQWDITWTNRMGNQPEMTLEANNLAGNGVSITLETIVNGSTSQEIGRDLTRTAHSGIQVKGFINNIPTACDQDCSFTYSESATPVVTEISPLQGPPSTVLTLKGTGFTSTPTVLTGDVLCSITSYTSTQIQCSVGDGPSGPADVSTHIEGTGIATMDTSDQFTITASLQSFSPTSGSLGGGTHLTITGFGFAADATVTVGANTCEVSGTIKPREIVCISPSSDTAASVVVSVNNNNVALTLGQQFTYDQSLTAELTSVSPSISSVTGGERFTMTGAGFGSSPSVLVGDMPATIVENTDTSITAVFPAQGVGAYPFKVGVDTKGYAVGSGVPDASYILALNAISPDHGSLYGGTVVTFVGQGFGMDASAVDIRFGSTPCDVISVSDTQCICQIQEIFQTHNVDNSGYSSNFGFGFAWNSPDLNVEVWDKIAFSWTGNTNDIKIKISEIDGPSGDKLDGGWDSITPLQTGQYEIRIPEAGEYWYRSSDDSDKVFEGKITAVDKQPAKVDIMFKVNNFEATYNINSGVSVPADSGSCGKVTSPKTGCSVGTVSGGSSDKFNFVYSDCYSGEVTGMTCDKDMVSLTGSGWSVTPCQNLILVGDNPCVVQTVTATQISCKIDTTSPAEMQTSVKHGVSMMVAGQGASLLKFRDQTCFLQPFVRQLSPVSVSSVGGATMTVSGAGLSNARVMINGYSRKALTQTYTEIVFTAPAGSVGSPVAVEVLENVNNYKIPCENCEYFYTDNLQVTSVTPTSVDGSSRTTFTINGLGFPVTGDSTLTVKFGSEECENPQVRSSSVIECEIQFLSLGAQPVNVTVSDLGTAKTTSSITVEGVPMLNSVSPTQGSENGNTSITLNGNGFVMDNTVVTIGGTPCDISTVTLSTVTCWTRSGSGTQAISVSVKGSPYTQQLDYQYASSRTPAVTAVNPTSGTIGTEITVTGSGFSTNNGENLVYVGEADCSVTSQSATEIVCTSGTHPAGAGSVALFRSGYGKAVGDFSFTYALTPSTIEPNSGGLSGGQKVSINGQGFDPSTSVTFCGQAATLVSDETTSTRLVVETPSKTGTATVACDVVVASGSQSATLTYTYVAGLTAEITSVSPKHGGTAGGTHLTITGTGFGTGLGGIAGVSIGGVACVVQSVTDTEVSCITGERQGSIGTVVDLRTTTGGKAIQTNAGFNYYDVWSSEHSWGGNGKPVAEDFVVIPEGQTILLDETTPVLKMLLIQGGTLIFDEKNIELNAEYILVTNNGTFQIGTEEEPFQSKAFITLHGHTLSTELPIYGNKVLAVRSGRLELHGMPLERTWTLLGQTAEEGDSTVLLEQILGAKVGDEIVIATTGHRHSQGETEVRTVTAVSADGLSLTLSEPLKYKHLGVTSTIGSRQLEGRAEVGLLTRNIVVRGSRDISWAEEIEACPEGFDTGEFATQTCFQGRFGDETGSDQFGAHVMMHTENARAKIGYVEFTYVGQAFRLGRYPIHFHLVGNQEGCYVKGAAIHETFNRALNIHGTHNVLVEGNVAYNVMGGSFFLEDGVETGNEYYYNLALFVKASSSLLNDDVTPAAFWATNPNNTYVGNHVAGGTHFGWWYRLLKHPEGPSSDQNIVPENIPYGPHINNTAHSLGWFGLWIFEFSFPHKNGDPNDAPEPAHFNNMVVWNCEKGIEFVIMGSFDVENVLLVNNKLAGFEGKFLKGHQDGSMHRVRDSTIAAWSEGIPPVESTDGLTSGVVFSYGSVLEIKSTAFYNYDQSPRVVFSFTKIQGTCIHNCGGYNYHLSQITRINSPRISWFDWNHQGVFYDLDGSLTGTAGNKVVPATGILPQTCSRAPDGYNHGEVDAAICPASTEFGGMSFNNVIPDSTFGTNAIAVNQNGNASVPYEFKRLNHPKGWMWMFPVNTSYFLDFENLPQITNISYDGSFLSIKNNTYVIICHRLTSKPDMFFYYAGMGMEDTWPATVDKLDGSKVGNKQFDGDWHFDEIEKEFCYLVSGAKNYSRPVQTKGTEVIVSINAFKCELEGCVYKDPNSIPRVCSSTNAVKWSTYDWSTVSQENCPRWEDSECKSPRNGDNVIIPSGVWMELDESPPEFNELIIYGTLQVPQGAMGIRITATYIYIFKGQLLVGCDMDNPFDGSVVISLRGNHSTPEFVPRLNHRTATIGSKVIAVFGTLMLNGLPMTHTWTRLAASADVGSNTLRLNTAVDWKVGDEVVVSATGYNPDESEYGVISATQTYNDQNGEPDYTVLTMQDAFKFPHTYSHEKFSNGQWYTMTAEVGLITRNIKVEGEFYDNQQREEFGGRIHVGGVDADGEYIVGSALISYVQFERMGQFGYTSPYDGRQGLVCKGLLDAASEEKPSYVVGSSFKESYSSSFVAIDVDNMPFERNVVSGSVGPGILSTATHTKVIGNMVLGFKFPGSYNGRYEASNSLIDAAVHLSGADAEFSGNAISGSERACWTGLPEPQVKSVPYWSDNGCHSSLFGIVVFMGTVDSWPTAPVQISDFTLFKNALYGIYFITPLSVKFNKVKSIDNGIGLYSFAVGPPALAHEYDLEKYVKIENSLFVGHSAGFDSERDVINTNTPYYRISSEGTAPGNRDGFVGVFIPSATSTTNEAPYKPLNQIMAYNSIALKSELTNCSFFHWNANRVAGQNPAAVSAPLGNDDFIHPLTCKENYLEDVDDNSRLKILPPSLGKINPSDCVDMVCDGYRTMLIIDEDGSFGGRSVPSEFFPYEDVYNGDSRYGIGDYRIPTPMLSFPNGSKIQPSSLYHHQGITRGGSCEKNEVSRYWNCTKLDHELVMFESMDSDTETRQLSPVASLSCINNNDCYINLVNGPQDHGWCSGYTCRLRLSLFPLILDKNVFNQVYFTSTSMQHLRIHMPTSDPNEKVGLAVYYSFTNSLDVYYNDVLVPPKNSKIENGITVFDYPSDYPEGHFSPDLETDACGTNFLDGSIMELKACGKGRIDVIMRETVILGTTSITVDEFFGEKIVSNLATFLKIDESKIRIVDVQNGASKRKKRSVGTTTYYLEISDGPCADVSCTGQTTTMTYTDLMTIASDILNAFQNGVFSSAMNLTINGLSITEAVPPIDDSHWQTFVDSPSTERAVQVLDSLTFYNTITPGAEGNVFVQQPKLHFTDTTGAHVSNLGVASIPWKVQAVLRSGSGSNILATLAGNTTVDFVDGWANFSDLSLSHSGSGFIIDFNIIFPESNFTSESEPLVVPLRPFKVDLAYTAGNAYTGNAHELRFKVVDTTTNSKVDNLVWNGGVWSAVVTASGTSGYSGTLSGTTSATFSPSTSEVTFNDLVFDSAGIQVFTIIVTSTTGYNLTMEKEVIIMSSALQSVVPDVTQLLTVKYDIDYTLYGNLDFAAGVFLNVMMARHPLIAFSGLTVTQGSVVISVTVSGNMTTVTDVLDGVCSNISSGSTFTYNGATFALSSTMTVDGQQYYGVNCEKKSQEADDSDDINAGLIIALVISLVAVVVLIGIAVFWKLKIVPKTKTHKLTTKEDEIKYMGTHSPVEDILWREQSFMSIREKGLPDRPMPGLSTHLGGRTTPMY